MIPAAVSRHRLDICWQVQVRWNRKSRAGRQGTRGCLKNTFHGKSSHSFLKAGTVGFSWTGVFPEAWIFMSRGYFVKFL